jgi:psiF repeat
MKRFLAACLTAAFCLAATAADPSPAQKAQQERMANCNKQAGEKKGDERKAFMSSCLSAKKETQQDKMKACNAQAEGKKGDERKAFMSECLKAKPAA